MPSSFSLGNVRSVGITLTESVSPSTLFLMLTRRCNLDCSYCCVPAGHAKMNWKTASRVIDLFLEHPLPESQKRVIRFFGGEPLLAFDILQKVVEYVEGSGIKCSFALVTNGTTIDHEKAAFLAKRKVHTAVSVDGPRYMHDRGRTYKNGKGSFREVANGIHILQKHNVMHCITLTLQKHNIHQISVAMDKLLKDFKVTSLSYSLPIYQEGIQYYDGEEVAKELLEAQFRLLQKGVFIAELSALILSLVRGKTPPPYCGGTGGHVVAIPEGKLGPCYCFSPDEDVYWVDLRRVSTLSEALQKNPFIEWASRSVLTMARCKNCPAIQLCDGGCPFNSLRKYGTIYKPDDNYCAFIKTLIRNLGELGTSPNFQIPIHRRYCIRV